MGWSLATPYLQAVKGRVTFFKFWDHIHISETVGARNFKFGMQIDHKSRKE